MTQNEICKKVSSLLNGYIENKISSHEREFVEDHLVQCPECHKKYLYMKNLVANLKDSYKKVIEMNQNKIEDTIFNIREHEKFMENISPYVDNEIGSIDGYEFRKYLMKTKSAQKELGRMYSLQKRLNNSYEAIKNSLTKDFSKEIADEFRMHNVYYMRQRYAKVAILAGLMIFGLAQIKEYYIPLKKNNVPVETRKDDKTKEAATDQDDKGDKDKDKKDDAIEEMYTEVISN